MVGAEDVEVVVALRDAEEHPNLPPPRTIQQRRRLQPTNGNAITR
jgi:hypothetical protein